MEVLITGGAGFIGANLVKHLNKFYPETRITVLDNFSNGTRNNLQDARTTIIEGSILDLRKLNSLNGKSFDVIFHLAASGSVPRSIKKPSETFITNAAGTLEVLEYAKTSKSTVIFSSSSSVYGNSSKSSSK